MTRLSPPHAATAPSDTPPLRITLLCVAALTVMSGATVAPSLPALQLHFADTTHSALLARLVLTLPALFIALGAPVAGAVADRWGRRPLLLVSVGLYALAGSSGLFAGSLAQILVGRALLGIAVAGTMTAVTALVGDYFSGARRQRFMSLQAAFVSFGGVVFLIGGGLLADWHWRGPFAIYALALLLLPAALRHLPEPRRQRRGTDRAQPLPPRERLQLLALLGAALINSLAFFLIPTQVPFLLREMGSVLPSHAGLAIGGGNLAAAASSLWLYRHIRSRLGIAGVFALCFAVMGLGQLLIATAADYSALLLATGLYGLGMGAMMPHLVGSALNLAPAALRGRISGALTASIFLGQFLSPLLSQPWSLHFGLSASFAAMGTLLLLLAVVLVIATCRTQLSPDFFHHQGGSQ